MYDGVYSPDLLGAALQRFIVDRTNIRRKFGIKKFILFGRLKSLFYICINKTNKR
jgi:hypothetical protein